MYNMSTKKLQQTGHISEATLHIVLMAYDKNHYARSHQQSVEAESRKQKVERKATKVVRCFD